MSLIDHLMRRDEVGKRDTELFWMKVAERDKSIEVNGRES